jgi:hypothetical protein
MEIEAEKMREMFLELAEVRLKPMTVTLLRILLVLPNRILGVVA